jgi:O-antigen/teichoic acid export membrane protein
MIKPPVRNALALTAADAGGRLIGFGVTVYLARVLDPPAFGVLNIGLAVLGYLLLLGSPGIQLMEARNIAASENGGEERVQAVLTLRLLLSGILVTGTWVVTAVIPFDTDVTGRVIVLYSVSLIPAAVFLDWFFQGREEFVAVGFARIVNNITFALATVLLVHSVDDLVWAPVAFAVGNLVASIFLLTQYQLRFEPFRTVWQPSLWKRILSANAPVGFALFLGQSFLNLPLLVLAAVATTADVGQYSAALKIVFMMLLIDRVFNVMFLPAVTRYATRQKDDLNRFVLLTFKMVLIIILPLTVSLTILAPQMTNLIFGTSYNGATVVLRILAAYFGLTVINSVFVALLIGSGAESVYTRMMILGSVCAGCAVVALAVLMGIRGAALGVVFGELLTLVLMAWQATKVLHIRFARAMVTPVLAGALMVTSALVLQSLGSALVTIASIAVFFAIIFSVRALTRDELQFLREKLL